MEKLFVFTKPSIREGCESGEAVRALVGVLTAEVRGRKYTGERYSEHPTYPNYNEVQLSGTYRFSFKLNGKQPPKDSALWLESFESYGGLKVEYSHYSSSSNVCPVRKFISTIIPLPDDPELESVLEAVNGEEFQEWAMIKHCWDRHEKVDLLTHLPNTYSYYEKLTIVERDIITQSQYMYLHGIIRTHFVTKEFGFGDEVKAVMQPAEMYALEKSGKSRLRHVPKNAPDFFRAMLEFINGKVAELGKSGYTAYPDITLPLSFKSTYFETLLRAELNKPYKDEHIADDMALTRESLLCFSSLMFSEKAVEPSGEGKWRYVCSIPWEATGKCFGSMPPDLTFDVGKLSETPDWQDDMVFFAHLKALRLCCDIDVSICKNLPVLEQLYMNNVSSVDDWEFLSGLTVLDTLCLESMGGGNAVLEAVKDLPKLRDLFLYDMDIDDLSPLAGRKFSELSLIKNNISDVTPLATVRAYYLKLSYNNITDASPLKDRATYLLDVSHNNIQSVLPAIGERMPNGRLFVDGNPISDEEVKTLSAMSRFVVCDVRDKAGE